MGRADAKVCGLSAVVLAAAVLLSAASAPAADMVFFDIVWPKHDKESGFLEWELRAAKAVAHSHNQYECLNLELRAYELVEEAGRKLSKEEVFLRADRGTYVHSESNPKSTLRGNVRTTLRGKDPLEIVTDEATLEAEWDSARRAQSRIIASPKPVSITSQNRKLTGEGMTIIEQVAVSKLPDGKRARTLTQSRVRLHRNVVMVLEGGAGPFSAMSETPAPQGDRPAPVTISCVGEFALDRLQNRAQFREHVVLSQRDVRLNSDVLTLEFSGEMTQLGTGAKLRQLLAERKVTIDGGGQRFAGRRFEWSPTTAKGVLAGSPATMKSATIWVKAERIEFDQKAQRIRYTGMAEAEITTKAE